MTITRDMIQRQGTVIVERGSGPGDLLVMFPDGVVVPYRTRRHVYLAATEWFKHHLHRPVGIGEIEWRQGIEPYRPRGER